MITAVQHVEQIETTGLMLSGGIDSAVLLARLVHEGLRVQPFYVSTGCTWEREELHAIESLIHTLGSARIESLIEFSMPVADLYGPHWSLTQRDVPDGASDDEAVALPGRNPLLLLKPMIWCSQHGVSRLALATLEGNPFADATSQFFSQFERALATALQCPVTIERPFEQKTKAEILSHLPDELVEPLHQQTFSCIAPRGGRHCGACNKCAERARVLQAVHGQDLTEYAPASAITT